jgi:hypothetical protein
VVVLRKNWGLCKPCVALPTKWMLGALATLPSEAVWSAICFACLGCFADRRGPLLHHQPHRQRSPLLSCTGCNSLSEAVSRGPCPNSGTPTERLEGEAVSSPTAATASAKRLVGA